MLYRAKIGHIHVLRDDNETAGMLACAAFDICKPTGEAVNYFPRRPDTVLLEVFFYISVGWFF